MGQPVVQLNIVHLRRPIQILKQDLKQAIYFKALVIYPSQENERDRQKAFQSAPNVLKWWNQMYSPQTITESPTLWIAFTHFIRVGVSR